ncbi:SPOR domain-containing protein [Desulfonema magnum]|nr:SPOR domain-containing protein [Desulfonema magnum]
MTQKQTPHRIRCPYCSEGFHPEGTDFCPNTGKPLRKKTIHLDRESISRFRASIKNINKIWWIVIGCVLLLIFIPGFYIIFNANDDSYDSTPPTKKIKESRTTIPKKKNNKAVNESGMREDGSIKIPHPVFKADDSVSDKPVAEFLSQLELGDWAVIIGSYNNEDLARKEIERIKARYPELFISCLSSELHNQYCNDYGEGKYFDGRYWRIYIGEFYSKESANLLKEKAIQEMEIPDDVFIRSILTGDSEYTVITDNKDEKAGWVFIGAYDRNHKKIFGNIEGYPKIETEYKFTREDRVYNIRKSPPRTVRTYYKDLRRIDIIGSIQAGNQFFIKEIKEFLLDENRVKIWAEIEKRY